MFISALMDFCLHLSLCIQGADGRPGSDGRNGFPGLQGIPGHPGIFRLNNKLKR